MGVIDMPFPGDPDFRYLDDEEKELIESLESEADTLKPLSVSEKDALLLQLKRAEAPRKNVTMRLSESVIAGLKAKAEEDGIPYQTLASMILQKYVRGALLERDAVQEVVKALAR